MPVVTTTIEALAAKIEQDTRLSDLEREAAAALLLDYARLLASFKRGGRPRKFASDKERFDYHNARRKKEVKKFDSAINEPNDRL